MDRARFSFIAHSQLDFANPISERMIDRALEVCALRKGQRLLDIGCGKAELLIRAAESRGVLGVGIELSRLAFDQASRRAYARVSPAMLMLHLGEAKPLLAQLEDGSFDAASCVGSSHAIGDAAAALDAMIRVVRPGGHVLLGEGYWKKPPSKEYIELLGGSEADLTTHAGNINLAWSKGLIPVWATTASDQDWDEYEWGYARGIEDFVAANPGDADAEKMLERSREWRRIFVNHGRETLGFGLYAFRKV